MFMFVPGKDLRAQIIECLKKEDKSISRITRDLKKGGKDYHRLMITGYLRALSDLGVIKEKAIPPSKVYSISEQRSKNLYQLIGEHAKGLNLGFKKEGQLCAQVLETLFMRPIFQSELNLCGYDAPQGVKKASNKDRSEARSLMQSAGMRIGSKERAYTCKRPFMDEVPNIIVDLLLDASGVRSLRKGTKQTTLAV